MDLINSHHQEIAVLLARVFLGLLFFAQGYDAVFRIKVSNVIDTYQNEFRNAGIPVFLTICGSWFTSLAELVGGALLILGLFEPFALAVLAANLVVVAIAFGIATPVWDTKFVFPRLVLLIFLLLVPPPMDIFSLDHLLSINA